MKLNGREIQIHDTAVESKQTIIGIHGLSGNAKQLDYYMEAFGQDYRFITMDIYGRGNSRATGSASNLSDHAQDIKALIVELGLENVLLIGYSMGAYISALVASRTPEIQAVVLLDGAASMSDHQRPIIEPGLQRLSKAYDSKEQYITEIADTYQNIGIETTNRLKNYLAYEIEEKGDYWEHKAFEPLVRNDWESFWDFDVFEVGSAIKQPVLLVQASGDIGNQPPLFLPEHFETTISAIETIEVQVSDANHFTMGFEKREDINQMIKEFFEKI